MLERITEDKREWEKLAREMCATVETGHIHNPCDKKTSDK